MIKPMCVLCYLFVIVFAVTAIVGAFAKERFYSVFLMSVNIPSRSIRRKLLISKRMIIWFTENMPVNKYFGNVFRKTDAVC